MPFLPVSLEEVKKLNKNVPDIVFITGDAYIDHPSIGIAVISRLLEKLGFTVAILSQPDIKSDDDFKKFGQPKYGFFISGGNIDSMVAHYTAAKKKRSQDLYTPGNVSGKRPDRATIVYSKKVRKIYPNTNILIGGLEASLRRFAHYDYWDDKVRASILVDSEADVLVYGMGEHQTKELADILKEDGYFNKEKLINVRGICYLDENIPPIEISWCPSFEEVSTDKKRYAISCRMQYDNSDFVYGKYLLQRHKKVNLIQTPPAAPLTREELDEVFELPFMRDYHPSYEKMGGVKAIEEVKHSIIHNRGCIGACNFCSLAFHQGRFISSRSIKSVVKEAIKISKDKDFKGYINDVGGPTANFRFPSCEKQKKAGLCKRKKCLAPEPCSNLEVDHSEYINLLREIKKLPGIKKVFIRSGIRFDYLMLDKDKTFLKELVRDHVSGQLKVAPEHCSNAVLDYMGKPHIESYLNFQKAFFEETKKINKEQYLVPYLMSSHPGSTLNDAIDLALFLKRENIRPEQVQDFYPTPGTISTCMFYTGLDPYTLKEVYVAKDANDKKMQRALLQYYKKENYDIIYKALKIAEPI